MHHPTPPHIFVLSAFPIGESKIPDFLRYSLPDRSHPLVLSRCFLLAPVTVFDMIVVPILSSRNFAPLFVCCSIPFTNCYLASSNTLSSVLGLFLF